MSVCPSDVVGVIGLVRDIKILNEDFTPHDSIIFNSDERIIDLEWMPDSSKLLLGIKESGSDNVYFNEMNTACGVYGS